MSGRTIPLREGGGGSSGGGRGRKQGGVQDRTPSSQTKVQSKTNRSNASRTTARNNPDAGVGISSREERASSYEEIVPFLVEKGWARSRRDTSGENTGEGADASTAGGEVAESEVSLPEERVSSRAKRVSLREERVVSRDQRVFSREKKGRARGPRGTSGENTGEGAGARTAGDERAGSRDSPHEERVSSPDEIIFSREKSGQDCSRRGTSGESTGEGPSAKTADGEGAGSEVSSHEERGPSREEKGRVRSPSGTPLENIGGGTGANKTAGGEGSGTVVCDSFVEESMRADIDTDSTFKDRDVDGDRVGRRVASSSSGACIGGGGRDAAWGWGERHRVSDSTVEDVTAGTLRDYREWLLGYEGNEDLQDQQQEEGAGGG